MLKLKFLFGYIVALSFILATLPSCNETAKASLATAVVEEITSKECQYPKRNGKCWDGHEMVLYLCSEGKNKSYTKRDGSEGFKCLKESVSGKYPNTFYVKYSKPKN